MKKILWTGSLLLLCTAVMADDSDKTTINGMKIQKITFDGDKMTVKYNDGTADATFDMAEVVVSFGRQGDIHAERGVRGKEHGRSQARALRDRRQESSD